MTDVKKTTDNSNIWTGIYPYWAGTDDQEQPVLVTLPEYVLYSDVVDHFFYKMVIPVDFSSDFQTKPTEDELRNRATAYVQANAPRAIPESIEVSFAALWQTEEYKDYAPLQKLKLCDVVTVYHRELGINSKAKIVSVVYDVLLERYEKMTIGQVRANLSDTLQQIAREAVNKKT